MKTSVYDKATWHIDGGEDLNKVMDHFSFIMSWCSSNNLLSEEGKEIEELGVDQSISLHSRMFTDRGNAFMEKHYDQFIDATSENRQEMTAILAKL